MGGRERCNLDILFVFCYILSAIKGSKNKDAIFTLDLQLCVCVLDGYFEFSDTAQINGKRAKDVNFMVNEDCWMS